MDNQKKPQKDLTIPKYHRRIMCFDTETSGLMPKHRSGTPYPPMESYPYIMQFSWILYNVTTNQIEETVNEYVKLPATAIISEESIKVHGITREITEEKGKPIVPLLAKFFEAYMKCDCIVAHNLHFDGGLVRKEMWRNREELLRKISIPDRVNMMCGLFTKPFNETYHIDTFCTMMNTVDLCGIEFPKKMAKEKTPPTPTPAHIPNPELSALPPTPTPCDEPTTIKPQNIRKKFPRLNELYSKLFDDVLPEDLHNSIIDVLVCLRCFLKVRGVKEISVEEFHQLIDKYSRPEIK
jgi:DNA polymerase III epsilon subunit-like protein